MSETPFGACHQRTPVLHRSRAPSSPHDSNKKARRRPGFLLCRKISLTGGCRDHMALTVVGQVLLFERRYQEIVRLAGLLGGMHAPAFRFEGVAVGCGGDLDRLPNNQPRAAN